ncbi:unnamed protein product [Prorocentrum cordatum]|uniref:Uncharacterized protein n=1 Tax=Prorocentrum cordatum TaxID=2364126 RepID=A0ABN9QMB6_9DINO|nr:unnamed protein product [Polarella glacialis]
MLQAAYASYAMEMGHAAAPARSPSFPSRLAQPPEMPLGPPALQAAWGQPVDWCGSTYAPPRDLDVGPPPGCRAGVPMSVQVQPDFGDPWCGRPIAVEEAPPPPPRPRPAGQPATGPSSGQAAQGGPAWQAQVRAARLPPSEAPPGEFGEVTLRGSAGCFGGGSPGGSSGAQGGPSGCGALGAVARLAPVHEARELHAPPRPASPADLPAHSPLKVSVKNSFLHVGADEEVPCMRMTQTVDCLPLVDLGRMPLSQHIDSQAYSATLETLPDDDGDSVQFGRMGSFSDCLRDPLSVSSITVRNTFIDLPQEGLLAQARQVHTVDYLPSVI